MLMAAAGLQGWADDPTYLTIVGGATSSGWTDNEWQRTVGRMVRTAENTWVWVGTLKNDSGDNGRFKLPTDLTGWSHGYWAPSQDYVIGSTEADLSTSGTGDNKFRVSEAGMYRITVYTDRLKIKAEKLSEPSKDGDYYLLGSVDAFMWFAGHVTSGQSGAKARLTANISFEGKDFFPISSDKFKFKGELDGAGHTIDYAVISDPSPRIGLCRYLGPGAKIHDLIMGEHCSFTGLAKTGGIAGHARDGGTVTLTNVINKANVTSTGGSSGNEGNSAGLIAAATDNTIIIATNCCNMGTVKGQQGECAALAGWTQSGTKFTNCWNIGEINNYQNQAELYRNSNAVTAINCYNLTEIGNQGTRLDLSTQGSGELCFRLNGDQNTIAWYQTIGTDAYPVPFSTGHSQVYATGDVKCDGTLLGNNTFTNTASQASTLSHTFDGGWCTDCGALNANYLTADSEGFYGIGNAYDLNWFADLVNTVNQSAKAKLTADIDYTSYKQGWIGASQSSPFRGTFDGLEHTITIDIVNNGLSRTGLFAYINAATIKNLIVEGSSTSAGNNCVGGLGGRSDGNGTLIENVIVKTAVSYTGTNGDATCGGFFANMEGQVTLKNCAFLGSISTGTAEGNGGLVGWAGGGNNNKYTNCLVAPTEYTKNGNSAEFARNNPSTTNCHYTSANDAKLASGELCYTLNDGGDNWYQNLTGSTVDAHPVPFSSHSKVYANAHFDCGGNAMGAVVYGNENNEIHDAHQEGEDGFCSVCSAWMSYVAGYWTPATDGYYEIYNNKQMRWFAAMIKDYRNVHNLTANADCNAPVNARLMNDIDFTGIKDFEPIGGLWGQNNTRYAGIFDGQHHKITNLVVDLNKDNVGVFGVISEGAVIKNFTLDATCSITGNGHVGIVGEIWHSQSGDVRLECLGNEANITGHGNNVGGILGVNMLNGSYAKLYMTNCYSTGKIKGNSENGQLTGWSGDGAVVTNCYAIGEMENCDGFARLGGGSTVINGYCDKNLTWNGHPTKVTSEQIASGEVCAKLGYAFRQNIGSGHPCFDQAQGFVAQIGPAGYSTMYNVYSDVTIPSGIEAFGGKINANSITLLPADGKIKAGVPVVLKGDEGLYNFMPATGAEAIADNELLGSDGTVKGDNIYALAKPEGEDVGFYPVANTVTIPEGRVYFVKNAGVKGYTFDNEDGATAIEMVNGQSSMVNEIYNLAGQRINKMQKGINIINGKKVLF